MFWLVCSAAAEPAPATQPAGPRTGYWALSSEDRTAFDKWRVQNMPNLEKLAKNAGEKQRYAKQNRLYNAALIRYRSMQQASDDPALLGRIKQSVALEDQIFDFMLELNIAPPEKKDIIREKIRNSTRVLVDDFLEERAQRIEKLKQKLDDESRKLDEARSHPDELVDERLAHFMIDMPATTAAESSEKSE